MPAPRAHYEVGVPYQAGGIWQYPSEQFAYDETGLAAVDASGHPPFTADGEPYDPSALAAAHQTLQLPAIARVTNLANGRSVLVRLNDRGPVNPGRLISLTPRVASLLGIAANTQARVRLTLQEETSRALAMKFHSSGIMLAIATAPRGAVQETPLAAPAGAAQSSVRSAVAIQAPESPPQAEAAIPDRLPEQVTQGIPRPGQLFIRAGVFTHYRYALMQQAQLSAFGAQIERARVDGQERDTVQIGPIETVSQADALLDRALHAGVTDARIVVE